MIDHADDDVFFLKGADDDVIKTLALKYNFMVLIIRTCLIL